MKNILIALALVLSGCADTQLYHPYKTQADFDTDLYQCNKVAEERAANRGMTGNPISIRDHTIECMKMEMGWDTEEFTR